MENTESKLSQNLFDIIRSLVISITAVVILTVLFAFAARQMEFSEQNLRIGNVVVSLISVIIACIFGLKTPKMGALKGFFVGLLFVVVTATLFNFLYRGDGFSITPYDIIFGGFAGIISGILSVNLRGVSNSS